MPLPRLRLEPLEDRATPATFTVTTPDDAGPGSLRDAIAQANAAPDDDTIDFAPSLAGGTIGLTTFTNPTTGDATGPTALVVTNPLTIAGSGQTITRTGTDAFRLFHIESTVTLSRLTLSNGSARGFAGGGGSAGLGGAIYNRGTLTIEQCTLTGNEALGGPGGAAGGGGGLAANGGSAGGGPNGGAAGGGVSGDGGFGGGGGRGFNGVTGISMSGTSGGRGGNGGFGGGGGRGGDGGPGTNPGPGGRGGNGGVGGGGGRGGDGGFGTVPGVGGPAGNGGPGGFGGNAVGANAGGGAGMGGAVFNQGGTVVIRVSTLAGNAARGGDANGTGQTGGGYGGAVFNLNGSVTLSHVTVANNTVSSGAAGGAHESDGGAVYNASVNAGTATATQTATLTVENSILSDSTGGVDVVNRQVDGSATLTALGRNLASAVVNTGGTVTGPEFVVAPTLLGSLQDNGGPTRTMTPGPNSAAIDTGDAPTLSSGDDQRGYPRPISGKYELGAVEIQPPIVVAPAGDLRAEDGVPFAATFTASGQQGPYTFDVVAGSLPAGLSLAPDGTLSGTPSGAGEFQFRVRATEPRDAQTGVRDYTLTVLPAGTAAGVLAVGGAGNVAIFVPSGGQYPLTPSASPSPLGGAVRVAVADVNGDGAEDVISVTGPGTALRVAVVSGADNSTVLIPPFDPFGGDFTGGGFVTAGDIDGDGWAEFVVTPDQGGGPRVSIFSLVNGAHSLRANFFGIDDPNFRGGARSALGDVSGDGTPELVVTAGFGGGPRAAVFDGTTLLTTPTRLIGDFFAFPGADAETLRNGVFVAAGDVNGDGHAELVFGGGPGGAPRVFILDGAKLAVGDVAGAQSAPVANFFVAGNANDRGGVRLAVKDADGDAKADVIAGSGEGSAAKVRAYLGANFTGAGEPATFQDLTVFGGAALPGGVFVG